MYGNAEKRFLGLSESPTTRKENFSGCRTLTKAEKEMFLGWKHNRQLKKKFFWAGNTLDSRKRNVFGLETRSTAEKENFLSWKHARQPKKKCF